MRTCLGETDADTEDVPEDPATEEQLERELAEANDELPFGFRRAAEKVRSFPRKPGVYLMKDSRSSYLCGQSEKFAQPRRQLLSKAARQEARTAHWLWKLATSIFWSAKAKLMPCWLRAG